MCGIEATPQAEGQEKSENKKEKDYEGVDVAKLE